MSKKPKSKKPDTKPQPLVKRVSDGATPIGQVALSVGDVVSLGEEKFIVDMVNDCRARMLPLSIRTIAYETTGGEKVTFSTVGRYQNISPNIEKVLLIERRGESGLKEFFASKSPRRVEEVEEKGTTKGSKKVKVWKTLESVTMPGHAYDDVAWKEIHLGGTREEIADRIAAQFKPNAPNARGKASNALQWMDEIARDMTQEGLKPNIGNPYTPTPDAVNEPPPPESSKSAEETTTGKKPAPFKEKPMAKAVKPIAKPRGGLAAEAE